MKTDGTILITTVIAFIMKVCIIIKNLIQSKTKFPRKVSNLDRSTNEVHQFWRIPGRNKNIGRTSLFGIFKLSSIIF